MRHRLTASALPRAAHCLYSFRHEVEWRPPTTSPAAALGTRVHQLIESWFTGRSVPGEAKLSSAAETKAWAMLGAWRASWGDGRDGWEVEVPFVLGPHGRATRLPAAAHRAYEVPDGCLPGTADAVYWSAEKGELAVVDWKTGRVVPEASTSEQLRFLAAAAADSVGVDRVVIGIQQITPERVLRTSHTLGAQEIRETLEDARALLRMVPQSEPVGGDWCRWCPAASCPERKAG